MTLVDFAGCVAFQNEAVFKRGSSRAAKRCGKCGQIARGHTCPEKIKKTIAKKRIAKDLL